jgi:adenylate cyclase
MPGRPDEHAASLAQHWEGADEALVAADWHRRAAEWVGARDRGEMSRHWQRVRTLLDTVPESSETLVMGVVARTRLLTNGVLLGQADDEAAALFAEGLALARRLDDPAPPLRIVLLTAYGFSRLVSGAVDEALAYLTESCRLADQSGNTLLQFNARVGLASALTFAGQLREALAMGDEAERLCGAIRSSGSSLDSEPAPSESFSPIARSRWPVSVGSERRRPPPGVPSRSRAGARTPRYWCWDTQQASWHASWWAMLRVPSATDGRR